MKQKSHADFTQEDVHELSTSSQQSEEESGSKDSKSKKHKIQPDISSSAITDYEKQRQKRIQENKAKIQALGLPALAASLPSARPDSKNSKKTTSHQSKKIKQDDNDYQPSTDEEEEEEEDEKQSDDSSDDDEEYTRQKLPTPKKGNPTKRRAPGRPKGKKMKSLSSLTVKRAAKEGASLSRDSELDKKIASLQDELDDDAALQQALALSMGVSMEDAAAIAEASRQDTGVDKANEEVDNSDLGGKGKEKAEVDNAPRGKRRRKQTKNINTIQLTEDEVIAYFFYFDEAGKGKITLRDLERVSLANDFMWTKQELMEMINAFDKDQDGQLILEDFQAIAARCNMIGGT